MKAGPPKDERITERQVRSLCRRLADGKIVRRALPQGASVHIDRRLPFLCVHRRPAEGAGTSLDSLIRGESSFLVVDGDAGRHRGVALLTRGIATAMHGTYGSFLILELWASDEFEGQEDIGEFQPAFRIVAPRGKALEASARELERALASIRIKGRRARVELSFDSRIAPPGLPPLIPQREASKIAWSMGIAMRPIHGDANGDQAYPLVRRALQRGLSRALKKCVFEFVRTNTVQRLPHFHSLGRRSMVKAVWEVDRRLAEISSGFDSLLLVTPTNAQPAWRAFQRQRYAKVPAFEYRALPFDPALAKRQLFQIPVERIEDPTLEMMFREQQSEIDRRLGMLSMRNTERFRYASLELFGDVGSELMEAAQSILARIPARSREPSRGELLDARAFAARAAAEIERYRALHPALDSRVEVRQDIVGLLVSKGSLLVSSESRIPAARVEALISHEVGTHVLTYANGLVQPFRQLHVGLAGYDELQEGLAVLSEYLVGGLSRPRMRLLAGRVLAVRRMSSGASFLDVFEELVDGHGFARQTAFTVTMRVFRSGGYAKDAAYLRGLIQLMQYLRDGGRLDPLFVGKLAAAHVPIIEELQWRHVLKPVPLRPYYLGDPTAQKRLERVRAGLTVHELVEEEPA